MDKCNTKKKIFAQLYTDCQTMVYGLSNNGLQTVKQWFTDCQTLD